MFKTLIESNGQQKIVDKDVFLFADILNSIEDSCSIAIDGRWGSGKTFFVHQVKMFLDANNDFLHGMNEEDKESIISEWKLLHKNCEPEYQAQISVYYDAWENDNDEDPVLSLIYTILKNVDADFSIPSDADFMKIASNVLEFFTGKNWNALIDGFRSKDPLDELRKAKAIEEEIRSFLDALLEERGNRLVVFVDELDRCKPSYAVRLLERIKHYFSNNRITFVFSINTNELQHTIKRCYGDEFDASRYLDRFFDLRVSLPPANIESFYRSINFNSNRYLYDYMCHAVISKYNFSLREIARYIKITKIAAHKPTHNVNNEYSFAFAEGKAISFCLIYIVPIMLGLKISDLNRYERFVNGQDPSPLNDFVDIRDNFFEKLLNRGESFDPNDIDLKNVTVNNKLEEVYDALFKTEYTGSIYRKNIGEYEFNKQTKETLLRTVSLLSNFSSLEVD